MTRSTKDRVVSGVAVGITMILIQVIFTAFNGRWSNGAPNKKFVEKTQYSVDRQKDLEKAFNYSEECIVDYDKNHTKEHSIIELKLKNISEIQTIQIDNIEKSLESITDWIDKQN